MSFLSNYVSANGAAFANGKSTPWANRPSAASVPSGTLAWFDLGTVKPVLMYSNGIVWRNAGASILLNNETPVAGVGSVTEQIIKQIIVPSDLLQSASYFSVSHIASKSATNAAVSQIQYRLGLSGTTADISIYSTGSWSTNSALQHTGGCLLKYSSDTQLQRFNGNINTALETAITSINAFPLNIATDSLNGNLILSLTVTMLSALDIPSGNRLTIVGY